MCKEEIPRKSYGDAQTSAARQPSPIERTVREKLESKRYQLQRDLTEVECCFRILDSNENVQQTLHVLSVAEKL